MKHCARCGEWKDEEEFNWRWKSAGKRQSLCRDCSRQQSREFYEKHQEAEKARTYEITRERRQRAQEFIFEYLSYQTCVDCGEYDFAVLTFDHVRGEKRMDVSRMVAEGYAIETIMEEIAKCEVVCANCHMRREQKRRSGGNPRFYRFWPKPPFDDE